jgi:hypothetical protein
MYPLVRITNGFNELGDDRLFGRASFIGAQMNDNPHFPAPNPLLTAMQMATEDFAAALVLARTKNSQDIKAKNAKRAHLIDTLHKLGNYVLYIANENADVATSSGFSIARPWEPLPPIEAPRAEVKPGVNRGELDLVAKRVIGARAYRFDYTEGNITENSTWVTEVAIIPKYILTGLTSGSEYHCRIAAIGTNYQVVYSPVVSSFVL